MAMNAAQAIEEAKASFKETMAQQNGGEPDDYEDVAVQFVTPVVQAIIAHITANATTAITFEAII